MKSSKASGWLRPLAFLMIAVILIGTIGFAAGGLQSSPTLDPESGNSDEQNGDADENKDGNQSNNNSTDIPDEPEIHVPEYLNYLTGKEVTEAESRNKPLAFVTSSNAPIYGLSTSSLVFEFPIEDGSTRFLSYTTDVRSLGKIGSVTATRDFITNIVEYFGGVIVSDGCDDTVSYDSFSEHTESFDLSCHGGYHYTEHNQFSYTNGDLISAGLTNAGISSISKQNATLPFSFVEFGKDDVKLQGKAESVILPLEENNETELYYSKTECKYTLSKNGTVITDMLNNKAVSFDNVFIIFCDSVTHESAEASELVIDTVNGGKGYYITGGGVTEITWSVDNTGSMIFKDANCEILTVNRGTSYFSFVKSSKMNKVTIS